MKNVRRALTFVGRLVATPSFFCSLFFLLTNCSVLYAQQGVVQGVQGVLNVVRPGNVVNRYDRAKVLPAFGEVGLESVPKPTFIDPMATYSVGVKNVSWVSREGTNISALAFYPTTPPVNGGKFSAVIYSHGLGASAESFAYLGYSWAGRGVVTICLRHPESDESIWRGKIRAMGELKEAYQRFWNARDRANALRSGIDFLYACHHENGPLGSDLDLNCIGVAGNDLGALGALLLAGQLPPDNGRSMKDPRVAGVVALSPPVFCEATHGPVVYQAIQAPTMVVTGTQDDGVVGTTKAPQRRIPYDSVANVDRYLVILQGGDHRVYAGHKRSSRQAADLPYQDTIRKETTDFWSAYLCKDSDVLRMMCSQGQTSQLPNAHVEWQLGGVISD